MSAIAFSNPHPLGAAPPPNAETIKKMLLENEELIKTIHENQKRGKVAECFPLQKVLHRNLVYLATLADANVKMDSVMTSELNGGGGGKIAAAAAAPTTSVAAAAMTMTSSVMPSGSAVVIVPPCVPSTTVTATT